MRQRDISNRKLRKHAGHWCNGLVLHQLQITHRQWMCRCQTVHYKGADGLTEGQQHKIMRDCEDLLWTDPSILLPEDRSLLCVDFESLGNSPAIMRQLWISEMEAATAAARLESAQQEDVIWENDQPEVPIDTEGSIWFRRRRKRSNNWAQTTQFPILEEVISSCMAPAIALLDCGKERLFVHGITLL
jgi:hypothetical protein